MWIYSVQRSTSCALILKTVLLCCYVLDQYHHNILLNDQCSGIGTVILPIELIFFSDLIRREQPFCAAMRVSRIRVGRLTHTYPLFSVVVANEFNAMLGLIVLAP